MVGTTNGDAFLYDVTGNASRYETVRPSSPVRTASRDRTRTPTTSVRMPTPTRSPTLEIDIMDHLKKLFPENCRFANYRVDIKTIAADTRVERIAPIPICLVEKNWKEY